MNTLYESGEMYLETILLLKEQQDKVRSIDIVREMGFSKPSVSVGMKKLKEGGYINIDSEGYIFLTDAGLNTAKKIFERHTILTQVLLNLGVSVETAQEDACKIEHIISEETFEKIKEYKKHQEEK